MTELKINIFITTGVASLLSKPQAQSMPFLRLSVWITHSSSFTPSTGLY